VTTVTVGALGSRASGVDDLGELVDVDHQRDPLAAVAEHPLRATRAGPVGREARFDIVGVAVDQR
jgi:hypothetical protein